MKNFENNTNINEITSGVESNSATENLFAGSYFNINTQTDQINFNTPLDHQTSLDTETSMNNQIHLFQLSIETY